MGDVSTGSASLPDLDPPGLDLAAVLGWLATHAPDAIGPTARATLIAGGRSNLTYLMDDGERRLVLRRPPLGHVLATAHDMAREHRIIGALAGTPVPVPRAIALCTDPAVTGAPFYAMSYVEGLIVRSGATTTTDNDNGNTSNDDKQGDDDPAGAATGGRKAGATGEPPHGGTGPEPDDDLDGAAKRELAAGMMAVLADLHSVDPASVRLGDFGRPEGFLARQLRRWSTQLEASRSRELPGIDQLRDRLAARLPESRGSGIVHGDYRLDNLVVAPPGAGDRLAIRAVLDWEMATLGDPLTDLGLLTAYWDVLSGLSVGATGDAGGVHNVGTAQGYPDAATLAGWYQDRRDVDLTDLPWYTAFGLFKLAVILEGIHYRHQLGQTVGEGYAGIGAVTPALIAAALPLLP